MEYYEKKIAEGKNFLLVRISPNIYKLTSSVENQNIYMNKIINFNLISLMYQTNIDKFEKVHLDILNDSEAQVFLLVKHLFKELGLKQRYVSFDIKKEEYQNGTLFILKVNSKYGEKINNCSNASLLPISDILYDFKLETPHKINITQQIYFDPQVGIPEFLEPIFGILMKSMHKKTLKFIRDIKF